MAGKQRICGAGGGFVRPVQAVRVNQLRAARGPSGVQREAAREVLTNRSVALLIVISVPLTREIQGKRQTPAPERTIIGGQPIESTGCGEIPYLGEQGTIS